MEHKIGEIFEYNGEWYQCIVGNSCENCAFNKRKCYAIVDNGDPIGECCADRRKDNKDVIFKKLEKVGEPYEFDGHLFQSYRTFEVPIFTENYATVRELGNNSKISIEIKQTKEDMEEITKNRIFQIASKYISGHVTYDEFEEAMRNWINGGKKESKSSLKEFDLEAAKAGKPVCTRDGRKTRIICFDKADERPIVALISDNGSEFVYEYLINGKCYKSRDDSNDLMMLPEKKEGWVNVYKGGLLDTKAYNTRKEAFDKASPKDYIDTAIISWEE